MRDAGLSGAVGAAWQAVLRRSDIKLAAFLDRGPPDDLEVLFASRSFLRLANRSQEREMRGRPMTALLAGSPECLEALRTYRPSLAGNSAIEWDCPWPGDPTRPLHRCVLIPFRATTLRGCLLAVDDGVPGAAPRVPAAGRLGRSLEQALDHALGQMPARLAGTLAYGGDADFEGEAGEAAGTSGSTIWPQTAAARTGTGVIDGQFGAGFGFGVVRDAAAAGGGRAWATAAGERSASSACAQVAQEGWSASPWPSVDRRPESRSADGMEPEFWQAFVQIAEESGIPVDQLWHKAAGDPCSRDPRSAVRTFVLRYFQLQGLNHAT